MESLLIKFSHPIGDVVCRECGVVLKSHVRYDGPEWREFAVDKADGLGPLGGVPFSSFTSNVSVQDFKASTKRLHNTIPI